MDKNLYNDDDFFDQLKDLDESDSEPEQEEESKIDEENQQQNTGQQDQTNIETEEKISLLIEDKQYQEHLKQVKQLSFKTIQRNKIRIGTADTEYKVIVQATKYLSSIDGEILKVYKLVADLYSAKFQQLEDIILTPITYVQCILRIKNETDLNKINFTGILNSHQIVAVQVAGSSTKSEPLPDKKLKKVLKACEIVLDLDENKEMLLRYIESRMLYIAPNMSKICGSTVAAQLIGAVGGIEALARIPGCNIQVIGEKKQNLMGMSKAGKKLHYGFFGNTDMVKKAPKKFQRNLVRILSTKCALAAKIDAQRRCPSGKRGEEMREKMLKRFAKIQEKQSAQMRKPLPVPKERTGRRRGGKKYRSERRRYQMTQMRKQLHRIKFGTDASQEYGYTGEDNGMLGTSGSIRVPIMKSSLKITKKQKKMLSHRSHSGKQSGLASSVDLASQEGIALYNPEYLKMQLQKQKKDTYFKPVSGFRTVIAQKQMQNLKKR